MFDHCIKNVTGLSDLLLKSIFDTYMSIFTRFSIYLLHHYWLGYKDGTKTSLNVRVIKVCFHKPCFSSVVIMKVSEIVWL